MCKNNEKGIRPSPQKHCNILNINNLTDFTEKNGTKTGQIFSLYNSIAELCKEKKCIFSNQFHLSLIFPQD